MESTRITPVDEITGLPLPIKPKANPRGARLLGYNYHHHFHPESALKLPEPIDIAAPRYHVIRYVRGQRVSKYLHSRYHSLFDGPPLPQTSEEEFRLAVLACAGVVPRQAIDLVSDNNFRVVELNNHQFERIGSEENIYIEGRHRPRHRPHVQRHIGTFFANYAINQELSLSGAFSKKNVDIFLSEQTTPARKKEIGNHMLREAVDDSLRPITSIFEVN